MLFLHRAGHSDSIWNDLTQSGKESKHRFWFLTAIPLIVVDAVYLELHQVSFSLY